MRAFISTSKPWRLAGIYLALSAAVALAEEPKADRSQVPEEDDYTNTPFTEYGEFHESSDEETDTKFLQHGRFFGVSLGVGYHGISGNRGVLWQGGFPMVDFKVHYWFNFNVALDLGFFTAIHFFDRGTDHVDVNMFRLGIDFKYYFDTKNLSAAISFANPYVLIGAGTITKTELVPSQTTQADPDNALGLSGGAGLEFVITPRKLYFEIEGKVHYATFRDTYSASYQPTLQDLTGLFFTVSGNLLFTW